MDELIENVRKGSRRAIARLITRVENSKVDAERAITRLYPFTGQAHVVGVTGPPGSGKSTLVNELALALRRRDISVGIIAVDPSSPFSGGALLGDRVRMRDLAGDRDFFIRSMASRGNLGGLSQATSAAIKVLDTSGFDTILVETVGAGQAEVDIAGTAHTTLVVEAPGMGDDIQSIKAGILEIADVLVVNKADRSGSARTVRALKSMLQLGHPGRVDHHGRAEDVTAVTDSEQSTENVWQVPVLETIATKGTGIDRLAETILAHRAHLRASSEWFRREKERCRREVKLILQERLVDRLQATVPDANHDQLITAVAERKMDPYTAVNELLAQMSM